MEIPLVFFSGDKHLRVKQPRNILQDTLKSTFTVDLYSRDFITNDEEGKSLVEKKYSGKITDTVEKIIKQDALKSEKPLLKGAYIDSDVMIGDSNLDMLSKLKSKDELIGEIIGLLQSPAKNVISSLQSGGNTIAALVKALSEREN